LGLQAGITRRRKPRVVADAERAAATTPLPSPTNVRREAIVVLIAMGILASL
jgi:hypothetical protein